MHRAIVEACLPCVLALAGACVLLMLLIRGCGARADWGRLRQLHTCEIGGVQSLSFVLTLPLFIMIVMFILQVSQLMVGVMTVNYAAFTAARAAAVWIPADISSSLVERENLIDAQVQILGDELMVTSDSVSPDSVKFQKIQQAAVLACAPICPSRDLQNANSSLPAWLQNAQQTAVAVYPSLVPTAASNPRIEMRLRNKLAYSFQNTDVVLSWLEASHPGKDVEVSPTYNPRVSTDPVVAAIHWRANEVGWEDPITVKVTHQFALLPGPGRFLAKQLVPADGSADNVSGRISTRRGEYTETIYTTPITASMTLVNEGIKSVVPYGQRQ